MDAMSLVGKVSLIGCMACWIHFGRAGEMPADANPVSDDPELAYIHYLSGKIHEHKILSSFIERKIDRNELKEKISADENYFCEKIESFMDREQIELRDNRPGEDEDRVMAPIAYALLGFAETGQFKGMEIFLSKGGATEVSWALDFMEALGDKFPYRNEVFDIMIQRIADQIKRIDEWLVLENNRGPISFCTFEAYWLKKLLSDEKRYDARRRELGYSTLANLPFTNMGVLILEKKSERLEAMEYYIGSIDDYYRLVMADTPAEAIFRENVRRFRLADVVDMDALSRKGAGQ